MHEEDFFIVGAEEDEVLLDGGVEAGSDGCNPDVHHCIVCSAA
jgi:hypothetical protein